MSSGYWLYKVMVYWQYCLLKLHLLVIAIKRAKSHKLSKFLNWILRLIIFFTSAKFQPLCTLTNSTASHFVPRNKNSHRWSKREWLLIICRIPKMRVRTRNRVFVYWTFFSLGKSMLTRKLINLPLFAYVQIINLLLNYKVTNI